MKIKLVWFCQECRRVCDVRREWDDTPFICTRCSSLPYYIPEAAAQLREQIPKAVKGEEIWLPPPLQSLLPVCKTRWDTVAALNRLATELEEKAKRLQLESVHKYLKKHRLA